MNDITKAVAELKKLQDSDLFFAVRQIFDGRSFSENTITPYSEPTITAILSVVKYLVGSKK